MIKRDNWRREHTLATHVLAATVETEEEQGLDYLVQRFCYYAQGK